MYSDPSTLLFPAPTCTMSLIAAPLLDYDIIKETQSKPTNPNGSLWNRSSNKREDMSSANTVLLCFEELLLVWMKEGELQLQISYFLISPKEYWIEKLQVWCHLSCNVCLFVLGGVVCVEETWNFVFVILDFPQVNRLVLWMTEAKNTACVYPHDISLTAGKAFVSHFGQRLWDHRVIEGLNWKAH